MPQSIKDRRALLLGWKLAGGDPQVISTPEASHPWEADESTLVTVPPTAVAENTLIVASSGGGKSYFVGRLLEEALLATRSQVLVLDPNGDFARFWRTRVESDWSPVTYNPTTGLGHIPTEETTREWDGFLSSKDFSFVGYTNREMPLNRPGFAEYRPLSVEWADVDHSFFHDRFESSREVDEFAAAHELAMTIAEALVRRAHRDQLDDGTSFEAQLDLEAIRRLGAAPRMCLSSLLSTGISDTRAREAAARAKRLRGRVTRATWHRYMLRIGRLFDDDVLRGSSTFPLQTEEARRFQVVDISSTAINYRPVIAAAFLEQLLDRARRRWNGAQAVSAEEDLRRPVLVVVEEAHNFAPALDASGNGRPCRDRLREIAAEGRKYALSLVLVTQRPEKVDPVVVGEARNLAVLGLRTESAVRSVQQAFRLETAEVKPLKESIGLRSGRVLLAGDWTEHQPRLLYTAMRRSSEGGRNLRPEHWAEPPESLCGKK